MKFKGKQLRKHTFKYVNCSTAYSTGKLQKHKPLQQRFGPVNYDIYTQ